jgi:hypothetical protein
MTTKTIIIIIIITNHRRQCVNVKMYQCRGIKSYIHTHTHTQRDVMAKKYSYLQDRKNIRTDRWGNSSGQECHTKTA